jgi:endogenous inhibitor of DNA gyrase (YacG/DUF329 family)
MEAKAQWCPICGKPALEATRPFCSRRCRDLDLARWLGGSYVVAGGNGDADEDGDAGDLAGVTDPVHGRAKDRETDDV